MDRMRLALGAGILAISVLGLILWAIGCFYSDPAQVVVGSFGIAAGWIYFAPRRSRPSPDAVEKEVETDGLR